MMTNAINKKVYGGSPMKIAFWSGPFTGKNKKPHLRLLVSSNNQGADLSIFGRSLSPEK
jgi:hypothetical protein